MPFLLKLMQMYFYNLWKMFSLCLQYFRLFLLKVTYIEFLYKNEIWVGMWSMIHDDYKNMILGFNKCLSKI